MSSPRSSDSRGASSRLSSAHSHSHSHSQQQPRTSNPQQDTRPGSSNSYPPASYSRHHQSQDQRSDYGGSRSPGEMATATAYPPSMTIPAHSPYPHPHTQTHTQTRHPHYYAESPPLESQPRSAGMPSRSPPFSLSHAHAQRERAAPYPRRTSISSLASMSSSGPHDSRILLPPPGSTAPLNLPEARERDHREQREHRDHRDHRDHRERESIPPISALALRSPTWRSSRPSLNRGHSGTSSGTRPGSSGLQLPPLHSMSSASSPSAPTSSTLPTPTTSMPAPPLPPPGESPPPRGPSPKPPFHSLRPSYYELQAPPVPPPSHSTPHQPQNSRQIHHSHSHSDSRTLPSPHGRHSPNRDTRFWDASSRAEPPHPQQQQHRYERDLALDTSPPLRALPYHERGYYAPQPPIVHPGPPPSGVSGRVGRMRSYSGASNMARPAGMEDEVEVKETPGQSRRLAHLMSEQKRRE